MIVLYVVLTIPLLQQAIAILEFYLGIAENRKQQISDVKTTWSERWVHRATHDRKVPF